MPIYEYKCQECGKVFEELVSVGSERGFACPSCSSAKTTKIMSATGLISVSQGASAPSSPCGSHCPSGGSCAMGGGCPQFS